MDVSIREDAADVAAKTGIVADLPCESEVAKESPKQKATVGFAEKSKTVHTPSADATMDGPAISVRRSNNLPAQRRGSRKQTLSLNPEEREALENLIEEVIMDGIDDGVIDSDGSSTDSDEQSCETGSPSDKKGSINVKSSTSSGAVSASGMVSVAGKKYYPGQLKVALKHMSNLPPRFVRKLAKAQQYLDAASNAAVMAQPSPNVGPIEEEEDENAVASSSKEELKPAASIGPQMGAHSPGSGQGERDKSKTKELKLKEAKKQIRTLLCDRDQYLDETSSAAAVSASSVHSTNIVGQDLTNTVAVTSPRSDLALAAGTGIAAHTPAKNVAVSSSYRSLPLNISPNSGIRPAVITNALFPQLHNTPVLSADVPEYIPVLGTSPDMSTAPQYQLTPPHYAQGDSSCLKSLQPAAYNMAPTSQLIPAQPDSQGTNNYYAQSPMVMNQQTGYYGVPQTYPPGMPPPGILNEMVPQSTGLVHMPVASVSPNINRTLPYPITGRQPMPSYPNIYSSPYVQPPPQSVQSNVYMSHPSSSYSRNQVMAYPVSGVQTVQYSAANVGCEPGVAPAGVNYHAQSAPPSMLTYPPGTVTFVPYNGVSDSHSDGRQQLNIANRKTVPNSVGNLSAIRPGQLVGTQYNASGMAASAITAVGVRTSSPRNVVPVAARSPSVRPTVPAGSNLPGAGMFVQPAQNHFVTVTTAAGGFPNPKPVTRGNFKSSPIEATTVHFTNGNRTKQMHSLAGTAVVTTTTASLMSTRIIDQDILPDKRAGDSRRSFGSSVPIGCLSDSAVVEASAALRTDVHAGRSPAVQDARQSNGRVVNSDHLVASPVCSKPDARVEIAHQAKSVSFKKVNKPSVISMVAQNESVLNVSDLEDTISVGTAVSHNSVVGACVESVLPSPSNSEDTSSKAAAVETLESGSLTLEKAVTPREINVSATRENTTSQSAAADACSCDTELSISLADESGEFSASDTQACLLVTVSPEFASRMLTMFSADLEADSATRDLAVPSSRQIQLGRDILRQIYDSWMMSSASSAGSCSTDVAS